LTIPRASRVCGCESKGHLWLMILAFRRDDQDDEEVMTMSPKRRGQSRRPLGLNGYLFPRPAKQGSKGAAADRAKASSALHRHQDPRRPPGRPLFIEPDQEGYGPYGALKPDGPAQPLSRFVRACPSTSWGERISGIEISNWQKTTVPRRGTGWTTPL